MTTSEIQEAIDLIDELRTFSSQIEPGFTRFKGKRTIKNILNTLKIFNFIQACFKVDFRTIFA